MSPAAWQQRLRVPLGWLFAAFFLVLARPRPAGIAGGIPLLAAGAAVRTWAAGHIRKRECLAVRGPYAHTRNPLYFGSFLMVCGALVMGGNPWVALAAAAVGVPVYASVIRREEALLAERFGEAFAAYARAVPRFFPRLSAAPGSRGGFDWALVRRNREWQSWLGALGVTLLLVAKLLARSGR